VVTQWTPATAPGALDSCLVALRQLSLPYGNRTIRHPSRRSIYHLRSACLCQGKSSFFFPASGRAVDELVGSQRFFFRNQLAPCVASRWVHSPPSSASGLAPIGPAKSGGVPAKPWLPAPSSG